MEIFDRTRKIDKIVASTSGSPDEHGLVLNLLLRLKRNDKFEFRNLMESLWGSDVTPERYQALYATLRELIELGIVDEPELAVFQLTDLGQRYMERDARYFDLDGYSKPITYSVVHWLAERTWKGLNRVEGEVDPFTFRKPLSNEIKNEFLCAFERRFYFYFPLVTASLLAILLIDFFLPVHNQAYGLILDIEGAVILAIGLVRGHHGIGTESESNLVDWERAFSTTHSMTDLVNESYKTVDAIWGSSLLIIGFAIQVLVISLA